MTEIDYQQAVIAGLLLDPDLIPWASRELRPEHFTDKRHQRTFLAMTALSFEDIEVDLTNLVQWLKENDKLEEAGGLTFLAGLDLDLPDLATMNDCVQMLKRDIEVPS